MTIRTLNHAAAIAFAALLLSAPLLNAAPMTYDGKEDIGKWYEEASKEFKLADEDAVILLEEQKVSYLANHRRRVLHHRVVWISTDKAIETYADLRIPWDSARQTFTVKTLRVWRDNRWIDARKTAVVETTPFALEKAPDYTNIRETMLLHDGIEIPCILEACWVTEDTKDDAEGIEGVWDFAQPDPVLHSRLVIQVPEKMHLTLKESDDMVPLKTTEDGLETFTIDRGPFPEAPHPEGDDPSGYLIHASWSTWKNWKDYGGLLKRTFTHDYPLGQALQDSLTVLTRGSSGPAETAMRIAAFVGSHTRYIDYSDDYFWPGPRTPQRTYATGYACGLDRAILFAALTKQAGIEDWPVYRAPGYGSVDEGVATNDRLGPVGVWASGDGLEAWYDPATSTLHNGLAPIFGRSIWLPGSEDVPTVRWTGSGDASALKLTLDLTWDSTASSWTGSGYYLGSGGLCPFDKMQGVDDETRGTLANVLTGALKGAELTTWNPSVLDRFSVGSALHFTLPASKRDAEGRLPLTVLEPADGVMAALPGDVHLYDGTRKAPVRIGGPMQQEVTVKLSLPGLEQVRIPQPVAIDNAAGHFEVAVDTTGGQVTVTRTLSLASATFTPQQWPLLRTLLLAETDARHGVLLFK